MPSQSAGPQFPDASLRHFFSYLARMRFLTLSVTLHGIVLAFAAGVIWYEQAPPEDDWSNDVVTCELPEGFPPGDVLEVVPPTTCAGASAPAEGLRFHELEAARLSGPTTAFPLVPKTEVYLSIKLESYVETAPVGPCRCTCVCICPTPFGWRHRNCLIGFPRWRPTIIASKENVDPMQSAAKPIW